MTKIDRHPAAAGAALLVSGAMYLGFASAGSAAPAASDSAESAGQPSLEEVVVTAQKRSENLEKVPIAVTALTASDLQTGSIEGQQELPKVTPNLNFTVVAAFVAPYIRGVGTQYANPGLESSVPIYLDDAYLPRASSGIFDFNDLARIEVLKGPQGTLYGRNATGGAIRIITNDPKLGVVESSANATYGSNDRIKFGGVTNLPLGEKVALRLTAEEDQDSGYLRNIDPSNPGKVDDRHEELYTAKVIFDASDQLKFKLSGQYSIKRDDEGMSFQNLYTSPQQIGQIVGGCVSSNFYNICSDDKGFGDRVASGGVTARIDYDLGAVMLSSISSYQSETENDFADIDATSAFFQETHGTSATRQLTQEFQATSEDSGPLKYVGGFYYLHERSQYNYNAYGEAINEGFAPLAAELGFPAGANLDYRAQGSGAKTDSFAPYGQASYQFTDQFSATAGVRYTVERKTLLENQDGLALITPAGYNVPGSFVGALTGPCTVVGQALCSTMNDELKFNKFTPMVSLSYTPDAANLFYVTFSEGFKSGGFSLPSFGYVDAVEPETLYDFEGGWKYDAGAIRFNGAAFFYNYKNLQVQTTDPNTATDVTTNGANAHLYGFEGDLTWLATERTEAGGGFGNLHSEYTSFPEGSSIVANYTTTACAAAPAACVGNSFPSTNLKGLQLVNAPKLTGYIRAQYTEPLGDFGKVAFSSIANYRSKTYFYISDQLPDNARTLLSARIQWTSANDKYLVAIFGENLTGRQYYLNQTPQSTGGFSIPGPPRQGYITGNVKF